MKVDGSLGSLVQGVSQQTASRRRSGQHGEQRNMISDPVRGLARRHGTIWQAEKDLGLDNAKAAANRADVASFRSFDYTASGRDLTVLYRSAAKVSGSDTPPVVVYDKTNKQFLTVVRNSTDALLDTLSAGGVSAMAAVGKYLLLAGNTITPSGTSTAKWSTAANQAKTVLWVRGGAYKRKYSVTVTKASTAQLSFNYETPAASYPGTLDTSGVPVLTEDPAGGTQADSETAYITLANLQVHTLYWKDFGPTSLTGTKAGAAMTNTYPADPSATTHFYWAPDAPTVTFHNSNIGAQDITLSYTHRKAISNPAYAQLVGDLTNAYSSAVTQWIGTAAAAIQPEAIAEELKAAAIAAGLSGTTRVGPNLVFDTDPSIDGVIDITFNDGGDGTLLKGVANKLQSVADLTDSHHVGKVVKVSPNNGADVFYMRAEAKNASITSGVTEVRWVEGAGIERTITGALVYGVADGSSFYLAGSATLLNAILAGTHPEYVANTVGDDDTSPMPYFVGRKITYLGIMQDRLLVGSGATIRASRPGDYLNFFRTSVLTVTGNDPFEVLSQGNEDDVIRSSVLYDRDLILFGQRQYVISGRLALTPTSVNMPVASSHKGADVCPPVAAGGLIFYAKKGLQATTVHQIEPGRNPESPESFPTSSQLDKYMLGNPVELHPISQPSTLIVRTTGARNTLFVYSYLDSSQERKQDCWHRWDYAEALGPIIGTSTVDEGLLVFTLRHSDIGALKQFAVADLQPLESELSSYPYLDSLQYTAAVSSSRTLASTAGWDVAFDNSSVRFLLGAHLEDREALEEDFPDGTGLMLGMPHTAEWVPTNPFLRDSNGKSLTTGLLTVTKLVLSFSDSSGFDSIVTFQGVPTTYRFNGRILGDPENVIGREPVTRGKHTVVIGRDSTKYTQSIRARKWLPLNITEVDWVGQSFHRPQRVS
jgi:hypothetical protein